MAWWRPLRAVGPVGAGLAARATNAVQSHGRYLAVGALQPDGSWKVTADIGNTRP